MKLAADRARHENPIAEGIRKGGDRAPSRAVSGHDSREPERTKRLDRRSNRGFRARPREVEATHHALERYPLEHGTGIVKDVDHTGVRTRGEHEDALGLEVNC